MKPISKKPLLVGQYTLGLMCVKLVADGHLYGGRFAGPEKGKPMIMTIGCQDDWPVTVGVFLHEALEATLTELGLRYHPAPDIANSSAGYLFVAKHEPFAEAVARVGEFTAQALPDLATAYKKVHP